MEDMQPDGTPGETSGDTPQQINGPVGSELRQRYDDVRGRIADAAAKAGRPPEAVTTVAVTKYAAPEQVRQMIGLGAADFGENYVQQLSQRAAQFNEFHNRRAAAGDQNVAPTIRWHMVGHLQRNKVKQVMPHMTMLHTVDSLRLAEEIDAQAQKTWGDSAASAGGDRRLATLLQINCTGEEQKSGVAVGAATHLAESITEMKNIRLMGVMTMAKYEAGETDTRATFARCREIFEEMQTLGIGGVDLRHLSMGMSGDYEWAVLEGATIVRVGSALFDDAGKNAADE